MTVVHSDMHMHAYSLVLTVDRCFIFRFFFVFKQGLLFLCIPCLWLVYCVLFFSTVAKRLAEKSVSEITILF